MYKCKFIAAAILYAISSIASALPLYTNNEVKTHNSFDTRIWVTYKNGVYDITDFIKYHPGGYKILSAAGGSIEPFWNIYQSHHRDQIYRILEKYRIGDIANKDTDNDNDPFALEPQRDSNLVINVTRPFNAESPSTTLSKNYITPNNLFFVRNHLPVPQIDINNFKIELSIEDKTRVVLSLEDLQKKYIWHKVSATIQCAGNRRHDMSKVKEVKGIPWKSGAISNAEWEGVLLRDILKEIGIDKNSKFKHVQFYGLDMGINEFYSTSIPLNKAIDEKGDVLLALKMNGEYLPPDHGYPVRVIVPGYIGARSVKWLSHIKISEHESPGFWQQSDYKIIRQSNSDIKQAPALQEISIQSAITEPFDGKKFSSDIDNIQIFGYAIAGGNNTVDHVDITVDGGSTWQAAEIEPSNGKKWTWVKWHANLPFPKNSNKLTISVKATDSSGEEQPKLASDIWNIRGLLTNSWHTVTIYHQL